MKQDARALLSAVSDFASKHEESLRKDAGAVPAGAGADQQDRVVSGNDP